MGGLKGRGEEACTERVDLILLASMMPGLDGFALCGEIRRRRIRVPVLMLTAKGVRALLRQGERERCCPEKVAVDWVQDFPEGTYYDHAVRGVIPHIWHAYPDEARALTLSIAEKELREESLAILESDR